MLYRLKMELKDIFFNKMLVHWCFSGKKKMDHQNTKREIRF